MEKEFILILIVGVIVAYFLAPPLQNYIIYKSSLELFENQYDLQDILSASNLTESKIYNQYNLTSKCFEGGERVNELELNELYSVLKFVSYFPYCKNISYLSPETTLEKGCGDCATKSCLVCQLLDKINYSCLIAVTREHAIALVKINDSWRAFDTTGYINSNQIDEFLSNLKYMEGKNIYYG